MCSLTLTDFTNKPKVLENGRDRSCDKERERAASRIARQSGERGQSERVNTSSFTLTPHLDRDCLQMPRTHPEAQQCQQSGYLQKACAAGVSFPLPPKLPCPPKRLRHQAGAHTGTKQAERLFFPAAAGLSRPPRQPPAHSTISRNSPCLPERAL